MSSSTNRNKRIQKIKVEESSVYIIKFYLFSFVFLTSRLSYGLIITCYLSCILSQSAHVTFEFNIVFILIQVRLIHLFSDLYCMCVRSQNRPKLDYKLITYLSDNIDAPFVIIRENYERTIDVWFFFIYFSHSEKNVYKVICV